MENYLRVSYINISHAPVSLINFRWHRANLLSTTYIIAIYTFRQVYSTTIYDPRYIFSASNVFPDRSPRFALPLPRLNYFLPLIPDRRPSRPDLCVSPSLALLYRIICSEDKFAVEVLTCSWREVLSGVGAASRNSAETPRTRCRPSPRRSRGRARYKAGVGPEGGRDGLEKSCLSQPPRK